MMKNSKNYLFALGALTAMGPSAFAQRQCNLAVSITAPAKTSNVKFNETLFVNFDIENKGPDKILAGDTIFYGIGNGFLLHVVPKSTVAKGAKISFPKEVSIGNTVTADTTFDLCIRLADQSTVAHYSLKGNGDTIKTPAIVTYKDADDTNDKSCVKVTFKAKSVSIFSINDVTKEALSLYPNPANTHVTVNLNLDKAEHVTASIKDITGREVLRQDFGKVPAGNAAALKINVAGLSAGLYFVELNTSGRKAIGKLTVKH